MRSDFSLGMFDDDDTKKLFFTIRNEKSYSNSNILLPAGDDDVDDGANIII